jgi:isopenicillin N synthase-like dioxygenase
MSLDATINALPTLDLSKFEAGGEDRGAFLAELRSAARNFGFFYLVGHGVDESITRDLFGLARRFFSLPETDKLAIEMVKSPHFRGYTRAGREFTRGQPDWREQIDIGTEKAALTLDSSDKPWRRLQGPNQWPAALPQLKPLALAYQQSVTALAIRVLKTLAAALEQPEDVFAPIYTPAPTQLLKIIRYPGREPSESDQGVGAHKDSGFVTILKQDTVAGLQVQGPNGWIDATPVPGSLIVNTGEILEIASNGYLRANVHRVVSPPVGRERLSLAFFLGAHLDATVPILNLPPHLAREAKGVTQDPQNPLFREVGRNYLKSRLRSHPDVAQRHHADLIDVAQPATASAY